jgi:hypothetical protein
VNAKRWGTGGSPEHELIELDRVLGLLARPARLGSGVPRGARSQLRELGLEPGRSAPRKELIEQVWALKRPLMRQLGSFDDPLPPCA